MISLIIAEVCIIAICIALAIYFTSHDNCLLEMLYIVAIIISIVMAIIIAVFGFWWRASENKAKIINREYGTHYTQEDIFYADDIIDTIQQIKRKRIELNGNIMQNKDKSDILK